MLIVVKIFAVIYLWLIFPLLLGSVWRKPDGKMRNQLLISYLTGLVTQWAIFFVLAKWAIDRELPVQELGRLWMICQLALTVFAVAWGIKRRIFRRKRLVWKWEWLGQGAALLILIGLAFVFGGSGQKEYTAEAALTMYATDTLYVYDPTTGKGAQEMLPVQIEELKAAAQSPMEAYYAVNGRICRLNPVKLMKLLLPVFLMTFYYGVYHIWAFELFGRNKRKRVLFQCILWLLYVSVLFSDRAAMVQIFASCWNGETLFFAGLLPFAVWLLQRKENRLMWGLSYLVCAGAGQLLYQHGGFIITFLWAVVAIAEWIKGEWKKDDRSI